MMIDRFAMSDVRVRSALRFAPVLLAVLACTVLPADAQEVLSGDRILPDLEIRARGWSQIRNIEEILDFALALVEITLLTLAIGFYPVDMLSQRGKVDLSFLRTLFLYALIGCQTALKRNPLSASKRDPLQR